MSETRRKLSIFMAFAVVVAGATGIAWAEQAGKVQIFASEDNSSIAVSSTKVASPAGSLLIDILIAISIIGGVGYFMFREEIWGTKKK